MKRNTGFVALALIVVVLVASACSARHTVPPTNASATPHIPALGPAASGNEMQSIQSAVGGYSSYLIKVNASNFVLPHWGGSDGGAVQVYGGGTTVVAHLARTGEPGATYKITLTGGRTYFQRSTCPQTFGIPGGSPDVLQPFIVSKTKLFANATNVTGNGETIKATLADLGPVTINVDGTTGLPTRITATHNGKPLMWTFSDWDHDTPAVNISPAGERGPGGIPC